MIFDFTDFLISRANPICIRAKRAVRGSRLTVGGRRRCKINVRRGDRIGRRKLLVNSFYDDQDLFQTILKAARNQVNLL
jgi:hypothetical protein